MITSEQLMRLMKIFLAISVDHPGGGYVPILNILHRLFCTIIHVCKVPAVYVNQVLQLSIAQRGCAISASVMVLGAIAGAICGIVLGAVVCRDS